MLQSPLTSILRGLQFEERHFHWRLVEVQSLNIVWAIQSQESSPWHVRLRDAVQPSGQSGKTFVRAPWRVGDVGWDVEAVAAVYAVPAHSSLPFILAIGVSGPALACSVEAWAGRSLEKAL